VLSRQKLPVLDRGKLASARGLSQGAYVLAEPGAGAPRIILIATGSEVSLALEARERLESEGTPTRVVSMPSWELFDRQPREYRDAVLPPSVEARLAIEAGVSLGWKKYVGDAGDSVSLDRFGASAPGETVLKELGFNVDNVVRRARSLL
jgi:transketolase